MAGVDAVEIIDDDDDDDNDDVDIDVQAVLGYGDGYFL